ncbi:alpha/beta hydrolase [Ideonella sp. DXS29W]|uniref:Alpha/beta hydrolase n=1 Tax=Ideonella lacteola TaxID=2984193 RepID=A0ABU9BP37_9BURK
MTIEFVDIVVDARRLTIEHEWLSPERRDQPLMVFLHEGLGSVSMWRDFPAKAVDALGWRGLVYSRPGYGRSTPRPSDEAWGPDFMHRQAQQVLPALLQALGIDAHRDPPWLLGHSDGGSIALLHAAAFPAQVAGVVAMAPHLFVEELSLASIARAREAYLHGALRQGLAKHHADVNSAFWGWNNAWLSPAFRPWDISDELGTIACPVLAIQGEDDEYGTLAQVRRIAARVKATTVLPLPECGHSPHRDQPERVISAVSSFVQPGR